MKRALNFTGSLSQNDIKRIKKLAFKKYRDQEHKFLVEGIRSCEEAVNSDVNIEMFIVSEQIEETSRIHSMIQQVNRKKIPVYTTHKKQYSSFTQTETPQGLACVVYKKDVTKVPTGDILLGLVDIRDPGNAGTILRTANWFGIQQVIATSGTVDLYNPKVVRSSMGAHFQLSIWDNVSLKNLVPILKPQYRFIGAVTEHATPITDFSPADKSLVLIGSEAAGLGDVVDLLDERITITQKGNGESLNAAIAAGIILYKMTQENKNAN